MRYNVAHTSRQCFGLLCQNVITLVICAHYGTNLTEIDSGLWETVATDALGG